MNRLAQQALLVGLAKRLAAKGSWTGETHIQKATFLLAKLCGIDFDFDFILYKHGPFSFELRDELASMQADGLLVGVSVGPRYGPQLLVTDRGDQVEGGFEKTMGRYGESLDWIANVLGDRGVIDLERLATALWMTKEDPSASVQDRAKAVCQVKPHISHDAAVDAVKEIDALAREQGTEF